MSTSTKTCFQRRPRPDNDRGMGRRLQRAASAFGYAANLTATCDRQRNPDQHVAPPAPNARKTRRDFSLLRRWFEELLQVLLSCSLTAVRSRASHNPEIRTILHGRRPKEVSGFPVLPFTPSNNPISVILAAGAAPRRIYLITYNSQNPKWRTQRHPAERRE
jgi:hypothetical protein